MSVVERINELEAEQKTLNKTRLQELEAERLRQSQAEDSRRQRHLELFEEFLKETGLRTLFEEIVEGKKLTSAEINTSVSQDGNVVSLEMSWPAPRNQYPEQRGVTVSGRPGFNKIRLGIDYSTDTLFVGGTLQKLSANYLAGLNPEDIEYAVARAYLDPEWESGYRVMQASEA